MAKYTIITINYNNGKELRNTIESVINQTFRDVEYIVVDGGSTDDSVEVIKEHSDRIDFWISEKDNGVYNAMNKGLRHAHGQYVNFMNSGDSFYSTHVLEDIDRQIGDTDILFGNVCDSVSGKRYGGIKAGSEVTFLTLKKEILCHQGTFYRREIFERHQYDESLRLIADWKVNVQAIVFDNCKVKVVNTIVANYDLRGMSSTQSKLHAEERQKVTAELFPERIAKDYEHLYTESEMPIVGLLPELKKRGRVQKIVYLFAKHILRLTK
ncbi:MAG: glycosyltransferase family 2 protein [Prevotella sp.]